MLQINNTTLDTNEKSWSKVYRIVSYICIAFHDSWNEQVILNYTR